MPINLKPRCPASGRVWAVEVQLRMLDFLDIKKSMHKYCKLDRAEVGARKVFAGTDDGSA